MKKKSGHKRSIFSVIRMTAAFLLRCGCQSSDSRQDLSDISSLEKIRERGILKVGTTGDYRPLSCFDPASGRYTGFDTELAKDLAHDLHVRIQFVKTSWPALTEDQRAGKFDLAVCGITISDTRKEHAMMSDGYLKNGKTILCRTEDANQYTCLEAVNRPDVRVMVNPGGLNEQFAHEMLPDAVLMIHDVNQEIPGLIACGKADIMITEIIEAGYYAAHDERLAAPLIDHPFTHTELGILTAKGSEDLLSYVNAFLEKEKNTGRISELAERYLFRHTDLL